MKTRTKLLLVIAMVFCLNIARDVQAHDLFPPPYRGLPATVMAEFEFGQSSNPAPPTNGNWIPGHNGEPLNDYEPGIQFDNFTWNQQGGGSWTADQGEPSFMTIGMPNIEDDFPVKYIRVQITWRYPGQSGPPIFDGITGFDAEDGPLTGVSVFNSGTTGIGGNIRQSVYDIRVRPNPDWEVIRFRVPDGMSILQVVVDTISVPHEGFANPDGVQTICGQQVDGELGDTFTSDDQYLVFKPSNISMHGDTLANPVCLVFSGGPIYPAGWEQVALESTIESHVTTTGLRQILQYFNWQSGKYETIDSSPAPLTDQVFVNEEILPDYVNPNDGSVRVRIAWRPTGPGISNNWNVVIDWIQWKVAFTIYDE